MSERSKRHELSGWGRFPRGVCEEYRPESRAGVRTLLAACTGQGLIPRGLGRSYGDPAINPAGAVATLTRLNRFLALDRESGLLECEGGVPLGAITDLVLPRGWFLPVTPGTQHVTVGGAIANDVHGKNHHCDGSFGAHVRSLVLLTPDGTERRCSRIENTDLFRATLGGVGLTGVILSARIQLLRVSTAQMICKRVRTASLDATLEALARAERRHQYAVAWLDCLAGGRRMGRGVVMMGDHAVPGDLPADTQDPLARSRSRPWPVPVTMPGGLLNRWSVAAFNEAYYRTHGDAAEQLTGLASFFYPLDRLAGWNRLYGPRGFAQYQATIPMDRPEGLRALLEALSNAKRASFLAVLKTFGAAGEGFLSYPSPGFTLALDLPNHGGLPAFLQGLDEIVVTHGGRLYLAKDACMRAETFAACYPNRDHFLRVKAEVDPENRLQSAMSRRLGLTP